MEASEAPAGNFQREDVKAKAAEGRARYYEHLREFKAGERSDPPGKKERKPKKPSSPKAKPAEKERAELIQIQEQLAQLLALPALGMSMAGDEWPAEHARAQAPILAHAIVERARVNAAFRQQLLRVMKISDQGGLVLAGLSYAVPILLYYEVLPLLPLRRALGVPGRGEMRIVMPDGSPAEPLSPEEQHAYAEAMAQENAAREAERLENEREAAEAMMQANVAAGNPAAAPSAAFPPQAGPGPG